MSNDPDMLRLLKGIRRLSRALDMQSRRIDRAIGLTLPQFVVLTCVGELGEVTSRAVSAAADMSPPTVVGVLDKLEAKGLIERYRSARDRRVVHARLTPHGWAALSTAPEPLGAAFGARLGALDRAERATLLTALDRLGEMAAGTAGETDAETKTVFRIDADHALGRG